MVNKAATERVGELERALANVQDERAHDFEKWFRIIGYGGMTPYQAECPIIIDGSLRELVQLRAAWETLRAWVEQEYSHWEYKNADRHWQMGRVSEEMHRRIPLAQPVPAAEEPPERPPMLLAKFVDYDAPKPVHKWKWWLWFGSAGDPANNPPWASNQDDTGSCPRAASRLFDEVDRQLSDPAALELYDKDLTVERP
jgi:hypothetical protein